MNPNVLSPKNDAAFLDAPGEMARRIRKFNWTKTPLGAIDAWPQSLRTAVGITLRSKFPMFIWCGPELIQFYNDAYRPSLGADGKHPLSLGQKGEECWPEIWPVIYPLIRQVLDGGEATWSEDQLAIDAAELGTWDLNPLTNKFTSNARLKSWFGLRADEQIVLTEAVDAMIEADQPRVAAAILLARSAPRDRERPLSCKCLIIQPDRES
jgi:hypothetical protein